MKRIILIIILFSPLVVLAHGGEAHLAVDPTALPGESGYLLERVGEWIEVNIFTLSTKKKQDKKLNLSTERAAEITALLEGREPSLEYLEVGLRGYQSLIRDSEYMAEKIIFLDGAEIGIAEDFEEETRLHEQVFVQALGTSLDKAQPLALQALNEARIQNETIFKFMVRNYQATEADIEKHQAILDAHIEILEEFHNTEIAGYLEEAEKFRNAGLNIEAYELISRAKNIVYAELLN